MKPGLGYRRDKRDARDLYAVGYAGDSLSLASNLTQHVNRVFDQGATSTCVAQAIIAGIDVRRSVLNLPPLGLSRLFPYYYGRSVIMRFADLGSRPREVLHALQRLGSPREYEWPFDPVKVNKRPPTTVSRLAADLRFSYERCPTIDSVAHQLSMGRPVAIGIEVDEPFTRADGPAIVRAMSPKRIGGHMMLIIGNNPELRAFRVLNSWGKDWRTGGQFFVGHDLAKEAMDLWAIV